MANNEKFCLQWNEFESNIRVAFGELRDDKDFFDVTLACDDEQIQAHKVILSACSPFFKNILRRNPHQHPLLYMRNIKFSDLQSVLNFMYHGEVNVAQEELNSFLAVAEDLRVKGLTQNSQNSSASNYEQSSKLNRSQEQQSVRNIPRPPDRDQPPQAKRVRPQPPPPQPSHHAPLTHDEEIQEVVPVKAEPREAAPVAEVYQAPPAQHVEAHVPVPAEQEHAMEPYQDGAEYEDYGQYEMDTSKGYSIDENLIPMDPNDAQTRWSCALCGKDFISKWSARMHVETKHYESPTYDCEICGKTLKNKNSYRVHITSIHGKRNK